jgi:hypothetical protein
MKKRTNPLYLFSIVLVLVTVIGGTIIFVRSNGGENQKTSEYIAPEPQFSGAQANGWQFIKDVLAIDASKFNVTSRSSDGPKASFATPEQIALTPHLIDYHLNSSKNTLQISLYYVNGTLSGANMYVYTGNPIFKQTYNNLTERVRAFLSDYQSFSGLDSTEMRQSLDKITTIENSTVTLGNLKLTITHKDLSMTAFGDTYSFNWANSINNCEYQVAGITFSNGDVSGFTDQRPRFRIGDTTVDVSKEQAIAIAMDAIKNYSYEMPGNVWISNFEIAGSNAQLRPVARVSNYLYPCWEVSLYFGKTYPGSMHGLVVLIWADSGKVSTIGKIAYSSPTDVIA